MGEVLRLYAAHGLRPWLEESIAPHLSRWEVICRCGMCFRCNLSPGLKTLWTQLREEVDQPLEVTSGVRCPAWQLRVNPAITDSMHLYGEALDIRWPSAMGRREFLERVEEIVGPGGLGVYPWGVHIDTGKNRKLFRRWGSTSLKKQEELAASNARTQEP